MLLYIKKFVQTLNDIDAKYLHDTHKYERQIKEQGIELGKDYPKQIVNHSESRTHVMSEFKALEKKLCPSIIVIDNGRA